jgi:hypothetical protein
MTTYPSGSRRSQTGQPRRPRPESGISRDSTGVRRELNWPTRVDYESEGRRFESCRAHSIKCRFAGLLDKVKRPNV